MAIDSVVLIDNIPSEQELPYTILTSRQNFGHNGKVLPNLNATFNMPAFLKIFHEQVTLVERICGVQNQRRIDQFKERLNQQEGTTEALLD